MAGIQARTLLPQPARVRDREQGVEPSLKRLWPKREEPDIGLSSREQEIIPQPHPAHRRRNIDVVKHHDALPSWPHLQCQALMLFVYQDSDLLIVEHPEGKRAGRERTK